MIYLSYSLASIIGTVLWVVSSSVRGAERDGRAIWNIPVDVKACFGARVHRDHFCSESPPTNDMITISIAIKFAVRQGAVLVSTVKKMRKENPHHDE